MKSARKTLKINPVPATNRLYSDFKNLKVLGRGQFGQVYRGTNIHDKMDYAIKVMELSAVNKTKFEVYANASLAISDDVNVLKHIVRYFSSWQYKKEQCIVMELCKQSLREYVSKIQAKSLTGIKEADIKIALRHACLGLKGMHD